MAITLYDVKPKFQSLLRPVAARLAHAGVTANQVTVTAMLLSVALGALLWIEGDRRALFLLLPVWLFLRMALNAIDGILAREFAQRSALGAYLNELTDVVSDAALYLPLARVAPFDLSGVGAVVLVACLSEMAGALGPMVGSARRYDGPMGKSDRALIFGALGLWVGAGGPLADSVAWLMPVLVALMAWNIVNRVRRGAADAKAPI
jgi:CDP-diacylglycerol--glycerol-3-phosphate 3-phosphatidyltransferase